MFVLHHYDFSPFSEKVRLAFGIKGAAWQSVQTPMQLPKPMLLPLTAGYRRAPVLQIGADVYCDTVLILREIERRQPAPTLYPQGAGLCDAVAAWWEATTFLTAARIATSLMGDQIPAGFIEERKVLMGTDFSKDASVAARPANLQRMSAAMTGLADMLAGKRFLGGDAASAADLACYHTLWFLRQNGGPAAEAMVLLAPLLPWMERVAALGHGDRSELSEADALALARRSEPEVPRIAAGGDPTGLRPGQPVAVRMDDMQDVPICGRLVAADATEIILRHEAPEVGTVHVHLPRAGYTAEEA